MPLIESGLPDPLSSIHIMGICGTAMGSLAGLLVDAGFQVTGSDTAAYPPMGDFLRGLGIEVMEGYQASNLDHAPDLVVVGNVIRAVYEEAEALVAGDLPYCSFPHLLGELVLNDARSIVVAGTHGKTTITAITTHLARAAGLNPGWLVGGVVQGLDRSAHKGSGDLFVIEGDEYDTAFFDKQPKFLHYHANTAILTSVEFDHADIYRDLDHVKESFQKLVDSMGDGLLIARWDEPNVRAVAADAGCEVWTYGPSMEWTGEIVSVDTDKGTMVFRVCRKGEPILQAETCLVGEHNLWNQVAAVAALVREGADPAALEAGFATFQGIKRRQEIRGNPGEVTVVDDFAHHPTAVAVTLEALRLRFGQRRLWAVFEPRSATSRRNIFQSDYADAFAPADRVIIAATADASSIPEEERMDFGALAADLRARGTEAVAMERVDEIAATLGANAMEGDVIALLSNGGFGGIHEKVLHHLEERFEDSEG